MRNVAFSVMLVALALLQVAVVSTEFARPSEQTAKVEKHEPGARHVVASNGTVRKTSTL
jgi:hypothetical protein